MKPSDARARETREWLAKAAEDLASAGDLAGTGHFGNALFFASRPPRRVLRLS
jgi:HEPN domain-containing protein